MRKGTGDGDALLLSAGEGDTSLADDGFVSFWEAEDVFMHGSIGKKLNLKLSNPAIEALIIDLLFETDEQYFKRIGKNIYVLNFGKRISITINSNTNRVITVDRMKKS